ncbi:MAG: hypothetical protein ACRD2O_00940 [Terriglobia bacterium]
MGRKSLLLFFLILLCLPMYSHAQAWSGIIDPSRAVNWSNAGIPGGIPVRNTQCGSTIAAYNGAPTTINNAIAACPAGKFVSLGAGTFNLTVGIDFGQHSNVTLRGQGANSTLLVFTGAGAGGYNSVVSMEGSISGPGFEQNVCDWTAGYFSGTTVITLANCGSTTPAKGSLSNLQVGSVLILDQLDEASDTGQIWNCATENSCANTIQGGEARDDGTCNGTMCLRSQQQGVVVTAISGSTITISPGLYMPNWRSGQKPQASFSNTTVTGDGVENLAIDTTNAGQPAGGGQSVMIANCNECWVSGIRSIYAQRSHVRILQGTHCVVQNSYFYENLSHATVSYGAEMMGSWDSLVVNNIFQQDTDSEPSCSGACAGNVIAYNFDINNVYTAPGWMQAGFYQHASGDVLNLWEGNIGPGYNADDVHGTHHFETLFRNYLIGNNQSLCDGVPCTAQTVPIELYAGSRYINVIGNVLGQSGYHTGYQCDAISTANCPFGAKATGTDTEIYALGYTGNGGQQDSSITGFCLQTACTTHGSYDPQVAPYLYRWGNYDTVTAAVRWCGNSSDPGWSTTCASTSEVPTGLSQFANAVPSSTSLPASFYYSSQPSWWTTGVAWPPIGPDVSGGNISNVGGHANMNPAMNCYINAMGGPADGSGGVLAFNASSCYNATQAPPAPPTNLNAIPH